MLRSCLVKKDALLLDIKLDMCEQCILVVVHIKKSSQSNCCYLCST